MTTTTHTQSITLTEWVWRARVLLQSAWAAVPTPRAGPPSQEYPLAKAGTLTLPAPRGHSIDCLEGCLWITQDGDPRDLVLRAGQRFTVERDRRTLIHALDPARVRVTRRLA